MGAWAVFLGPWLTVIAAGEMILWQDIAKRAGFHTNILFFS